MDREGGQSLQNSGPSLYPGPPRFRAASQSSMDRHLLPPASQPVVAVVDDEPQVRRYLVLALAPLNAEVVEFGSAAEFRAAIDVRPLDCAVIDLRLPDGTGLELAAEVRSRELAVSLVLVTGNASVKVAVQAVRDGVIDVLEKPFAPGEVLAAVTRGISLCQQRRADGRKSGAAKERLASLSESEREVLELVIAGLPNKVIARTLGLGLRTVESRKQRLYLKLAANSISKLVQAALAGG
jgi:two-component system, LuxR family, response regulator FixJ